MNYSKELCTVLILGCVIAAGCGGTNGTDSEGGEPAPPALPAQFLAGKATYDAGCSSCHDSSRDGSPRLGYLAAWSRRLAQGEEVLVQHAIEGLDLMPPKGDNPDLTDEQIADVVRYMIYRAEQDVPATH